MEEELGPGCPTCGDVAVEVARDGELLTMVCADPACGRRFTMRHRTRLNGLPGTEGWRAGPSA